MLNRFTRVARRLLPSVHPSIRDLPRADRTLISDIRARKLTYLSEAKLRKILETCRSIESSGLEGAFVEAGCALGGSTILIAKTKAEPRPLYVYDTFAMIPPPTAEDPKEVHERYRIIVTGQAKGIGGARYYGYEPDLLNLVRTHLRQFGVSCEAQQVHLTRGLVQDTMNVEWPVTFAHIDVDWYDPVKTCLERLVPRLCVGGAVILDDYHDWGGCRKATDEYFSGQEGRFLMDDSAGSMKVTKLAP